jgi:hypothetical protein
MTDTSQTSQTKTALLYPGSGISDMVATAWIELGFGLEDAKLAVTGAPFVLPCGLACRLMPDPGAPEQALRPEIGLALVLDDLERADVAKLLNLQTVMNVTMGWYIGTSQELGMLFLTPLVAPVDAAELVHSLSSGGALGLSVLQMLAGQTQEQQVPTAAPPSPQSPP